MLILIFPKLSIRNFDNKPKLIRSWNRHFQHINPPNISRPKSRPNANSAQKSHPNLQSYSTLNKIRSAASESFRFMRIPFSAYKVSGCVSDLFTATSSSPYSAPGRISRRTNEPRRRSLFFGTCSGGRPLKKENPRKIRRRRRPSIFSLERVKGFSSILILSVSAHLCIFRFPRVWILSLLGVNYCFFILFQMGVVY